MKNPWVLNLTLLLIAAIWGFGFVPQREGMNYVGPSAFNALRFALGAATLIPVLLLSRRVQLEDLFDRNTFWLGVLLGALLFGGATFQQISIQYTTLANVAFITGLYVIVVPAIGFFIGYRYKAIVWIGGLVAIAGLYLMTGSSNEISLRGDLLAMVGAVFWAVHILVLARRAMHHNQLALAFYQFVFCAVFSMVVAVGHEGQLLPEESMGYLWPALNGIIVVGFAYTVQVIVMEYAEPFAASLMFSLEAVFGALAGYFVYTEQLGAAALAGAAMMMIGCILAQLPGTQTKVESADHPQATAATSNSQA